MERILGPSAVYAALQLSAAMLLSTATAQAADESPLPPPEYAIAATWALGGAGGWDYLALEASGARLFISRGDRVDVVETASGKLAGSIPNTQGVHGIAFAPELKRGYTSNGRANTVTVFELDTLRTVKEAAVSGTKPDAILYEPQRQHVFTANGASSNLSVLDPQTLEILSTIALPGPPEFMATDGSGSVFVNIETDPGKLVLIDAKALEVKGVWPLTGCANPTGLAIDRVQHRLFSVCDNQVMAVTDSVSGKQVAQVAIGKGPDAAAFDPGLGYVFSSNGADGTLTIIHQDAPDKYRVITTLSTQASARTMALDQPTHRIFLAAATPGATPPASAEQPHPRPGMVPGSFVILVAKPK
jgi:DNA-binding beta-propeller fold protein YncE